MHHGALHIAAFIKLRHAHVHVECVIGYRTLSLTTHFWFGAGVFDGDVVALAFDLRRGAAFHALLVNVGAVGVHIFLRHALLKVHRDFHAKYFRHGGVFVLAGLEVLRAGRGQAHKGQTGKAGDFF